MIHLKEKKDCCGCTACVERCPKQCIVLRADTEGFLYPFVHEDACINCGLCENVCPVLHPGKERKPLHTYAAKNKNEIIRLQSSSGGLFTLLAEQTINREGIVFGARFNENWEVVHAYTRTLEGLSAFRGSKYVQSFLGDTYRQVESFLKQGCHVLFSGTPCQVAGLKHFLGKEYDTLLTVDFVCHGVPSPKIWRMYLQGLYTNHEDMRKTVLKKEYDGKTNNNFITQVNFRDKQISWKKYSLSILFRKSDKNEMHALSEPLDQNIFMKGFLSDLYLRPSCYSCPCRSLRSGSDITMGDYWGIQDKYPDFDDDKGVSLVLITSEKGKTIYRDLDIEMIETTYKDAFIYNPALLKSVRLPKKRNLFFQQLKSQNLFFLIDKMTADGFFKAIIKYAYFHFGGKNIKKIIKKKFLNG